jgi:hypothetical protein
MDVPPFEKRVNLRNRTRTYRGYLDILPDKKVHPQEQNWTSGAHLDIS